MTAQNALSRPRVSAAVVVLADRPEDLDLLALTIHSVQSVAEEIVVVDTGLSAEAREHAAQLGARVSSGAWNDDFSAARNHSLNQLAGPWVLWLEAGEQLDEETGADLRAFLDQEASPEKVYALLVEAPPAEQAASGEQAAQVRLMPNRADLWFEGRVRETLEPAMAAGGVELDLAPGRIVRHPRQHDPECKARHARRILDLVALERAQKPKPDVRLLLAAAEAASELGDGNAARRAFAQAVQAAARGSTEMLEAYYGWLSSWEGHPGAAQGQIAVCLEALEVFPLDAQLLCAMGTYLQAQRRWELASRAFEAAVKYGQVNLQTWHLADVAELSAACLALSLQLLGRDEEARGVLEQSLGRRPDSLRLRRQLVDLHVKHARLEEAVRAAGPLASNWEVREALRNAVRGACQASARNWTAALAYLQSAYLAGCRDPICLRGLAVVLLSTGRAQAAVPLLHQWRDVEPGNAELRAYLDAVAQASRTATGRRTPHAQPAPNRWLRIDPAASVVDTAAFPMPVISQVSSAD